MNSLRAACGVPLLVALISGQALAGDPAAEAELQRLRDSYQELAHYRDTMATRTHVAMGQAQHPVVYDIESTTSLVFERGGRLALRSPVGQVVCDGRMLWHVDGNGLRFTEQQAPEQLTQADVTLLDIGVSSFMGGPDMGLHPLLGVLYEGFADLSSPLRNVEAVGLRQVKEAGTSYRVLSLHSDLSDDPQVQMYGLDPEGTAELPKCAVEVWINADTGLVSRMQEDSTALMQALVEQWQMQGMMPTYQAVQTTWTFEPVSTEAPGDDAFAFDPEGMELVDSLAPDFSDMMGDFDFGGGGVEGADFVHQPAPDFAGTTVKDEPFALSELRGKVVLLDFWATWCGPCVAAIPEIQKISQEFADQGVVVVGVNQDGEGMEEKVAEFLADKEITFTQVMDLTDEIGGMYEVAAIPTTVLIDREGVVQAYHVGFGGGDVYRDEIRRVLAGEALEKPAAPPPAIAEEMFVHPEAVQVVQSGEAPVSAWLGRSVQTASGPAFIAPGDEGGLMKFNPERFRFEKIRFQSGGEARATIAFVPIMEHDELAGWVLATDSAGGYSDLEITRYDAAGQRLWSTPLGVDPSSQSGYEARVELGDLNGDDDKEIIAFVGITSGNSFEQTQMLMVLKSDGTIITRAPIEVDGLGSMKVMPATGDHPARIVLFGYSEMISVELGM